MALPQNLPALNIPAGRILSIISGTVHDNEKKMCQALLLIKVTWSFNVQKS
jgi:hypothetical protein